MDIKVLCQKATRTYNYRGPGIVYIRTSSAPKIACMVACIPCVHMVVRPFGDTVYSFRLRFRDVRYSLSSDHFVGVDFSSQAG